jgi:DNA repair exonuclease SbcCD nuclease subunit
MRIAITADWHYDDYPNLVSAMKGSVSSRVDDISKAVGWILEEAERRRVDRLVVLGDVFHKRDLISVPVYNIVVEDMTTDDRCCNFSTIILAGNHDQTTKGGLTNSLYALGLWDGITIYDKILEEEGDIYLPYMESYPPLWEGYGLPESSIIYGHCGIVGSRMTGFENAKKAEITPEELQLDKIAGGFFGHYHIHQQIAKRAWYVGAPLQHSFRDVNNKCGFMVVDIDEDGKLVETEFIENTFSPKFHIVDVSKDDPRKYPATDFIRLRNATNEDLVDLISLPNIIGIDREEIQEQSERSYLSLGEDSLVLADKWVDNNCNDPRRARRLKEIGKDILRKVME